MKNIFSTFLVCVLFFLAACDKEEEEVTLTFEQQFSELSEDLYYDDEILSVQDRPLYSWWKIYNTSGGFAGTGYPKEFDLLILKPNGIFGFVRNDSLITIGKITAERDTMIDDRLSIQFIPDSSRSVAFPNLFGNFVTMQSDTLHLSSGCCDQFDTHLRLVR